MIFFIDYSYPKLAPIWYADAEGIFTPKESGLYDFGLSVQGTGCLYIDDETSSEMSKIKDRVRVFWGPARWKRLV